MPPPPAPAPFTDADYEMIAAAVLETARGRWFLAEHARRNRHADTRLVLEAIEKLERSVVQRNEGIEPERVRVDLVEMMNAITRTKAEIAAIRPPRNSDSHIGQASSELDAIVDTTEKATSDILAAAERVQEMAWKLRERGVDASVCDLIDSHAAEIYTSCSFQDLTGQRIRKVVEVLRFLEDRIDAMIRIWRLDDLDFVQTNGAKPAPQVRGPSNGGLHQHAVDEIIGAERKQDVFWRETRVREGRDPRNLGEFDLEDLVVFEASPEAQPEIIPPVRTGSVAAATPPVPSANGAGADTPSATPEKEAEKKDGIESLTFAERMALFG
jgi:chemotaxis regulatin CheY-phosphate phosphatase CheZ